tara:strand:- start:3918 stop:4286 length:369 start_codon:yes stop_codon:yes gene_type:complete
MKSKVRPQLSDLVNTGTLEIEKFQNDTIRPIIKMQHNFLIISFKNYIKKSKTDFYNIKTEKQKEKINSILTKDIIFKNMILGGILGQLNDTELIFYLKDSSELKKRILQIIKQRLQDSFTKE